MNLEEILRSSSTEASNSKVLCPPNAFPYAVRRGDYLYLQAHFGENNKQAKFADGG
jgi:hypothetical protein